MPASLNVDSRVITVPYRAAFLLVSSAVAWAVLSNARRRYGGAIWYPFLIFWMLYIVRLMHDTVYPPERLARPIGEFYLYAIGTCLLPSLAFFNRMDELTVRRALLATLIVVGAGAVATVAFNYQALGTEFGRSVGNEYLNPITVGHLAVTLVVLCAYLLLQRPPSVNVPKPLLWLGILLALPCLALSASRGPVVALTVMLLLLCVHAYRRGQKLLVIALVAVIAVASPFVIDAIAKLGSDLVERLNYTLSHYEDEARIGLVAAAWSQFLDHPIIGSAIVEKTSGNYPHNLVVESFMATGILGGLAFTMLLLAGVRAALRLILNTRVHAWLGLLFVQLAVWTNLSGSLYTHFTFWYLLAAVIGVDARDRGRPRTSRPHVGVDGEQSAAPLLFSPTVASSIARAPTSQRGDDVFALGGLSAS